MATNQVAYILLLILIIYTEAFTSCRYQSRHQKISSTHLVNAAKRRKDKYDSPESFHVCLPRV